MNKMGKKSQYNINRPRIWYEVYNVIKVNSNEIIKYAKNYACY